MKITRHLLHGDAAKKVAFSASPNHGGEFAAGLPDTIVLHCTAGRDAKSAILTLKDPTVKSSSHLVVGRDGSVTQLVPFNAIAWHAGKSAWEGRTGLNDFSLGIEIDNAGRLDRQGEKYFSWFGKEYPRDEVFEGVHRNESEISYWHRYQEQDIELVRKICSLLIKAYPIKLILGHEEIAPGRKVDPGPAFPLDRLREKLLAADRDGSGPPSPVIAKPLASGVVIASSLNIRRDPLASAPKAADPLAQGAAVKILARKPGWLYVSAECKGWVSAEFVRETAGKEGG
ncbi:MAG: N-acetylmuramyl-L-alanine amidase, negative regulator of AmpC, AmpD [Fibrobacteres bacterium]|nr:N-acetylmuramyl-L-alanine amidase, negative regulator of AmpC, AmpD [Fibrobacterota bacterium]